MNTTLPEHIKSGIGLLRQWLNEKPADLLVTNEHILEFLKEPIAHTLQTEIEKAVGRAHERAITVAKSYVVNQKVGNRALVVIPEKLKTVLG